MNNRWESGVEMQDLATSGKNKQPEQPANYLVEMGDTTNCEGWHWHYTELKYEVNPRG